MVILSKPTLMQWCFYNSMLDLNCKNNAMLINDNIRKNKNMFFPRPTSIRWYFSTYTFLLIGIIYVMTNIDLKKCMTLLSKNC